MYFNDTDRSLYRSLHGGLLFSTIKIGESDLHVGAPKENAQAVFERAETALREARGPLEAYVKAHPEFLSALLPLDETPDMPDIAREMCKAAQVAGVGPMAAVAGAINDALAYELLKLTGEFILENGGDIFIQTRTARNILIYAGKSPLSGKLGVRIPPGTWSVCTSSATVGHALSFGKADAALIITKSICALSDAMATALGNRIKTFENIEPALDWALGAEGVCGALAVVGGAFGAKGDVELIGL